MLESLRGVIPKRPALSPAGPRDLPRNRSRHSSEDAGGCPVSRTPFAREWGFSPELCTNCHSDRSPSERDGAVEESGVPYLEPGAPLLARPFAREVGIFARSAKKSLSFRPEPERTRRRSGGIWCSFRPPALLRNAFRRSRTIPDRGSPECPSAKFTSPTNYRSGRLSAPNRPSLPTRQPPPETGVGSHLPGSPTFCGKPRPCILCRGGDRSPLVSRHVTIRSRGAPRNCAFHHVSKTPRGSLL